jgi:hypothetical protein
MKPLKLVKATALSFALGAILSVTSDSKLMHQVEEIAFSEASGIATSAMRKVWEWLVMAGRKRSF